MRPIISVLAIQSRFEFQGLTPVTVTNTSTGAANALSTQDPVTRDLCLLNSQGAGSLQPITDNL